MVPALKSEFRKLLTVRSTYVIIAISLALTAFFSFYVSGWRADRAALHDPGAVASAVTGAVGPMALIAALAGVLLLTHEYRHNTITYTLTASNSRSKVLLAKILVMSVFAVLFTAVIGAFSPLAASLGVHAHHLTAVPQTVYYRDLIWRSLFYGWGYSMAGLLLAALIRNQIGAIVTLFIVPGTLESLLGLLLKKHAVYLPFSALGRVIGNHSQFGGQISTTRAALVFSVYLVAGWLVAWILFLKRDVS